MCSLVRSARAPRGRTSRLSALLVAGALLAGCAQEESIIPPKPTHDVSDVRAEQAQVALDRLATAVRTRDVGAARRLAAPGSADLLVAMVRNAAALRLRLEDVRFISDLRQPVAGNTQARLGGRAWVAQTQLDYRIPHYDDSATRLSPAVVFAPGRHGLRIASIGGYGQRTPSWTMGMLQVARTPRTLVLAAQGQDVRAFSRRAVVAVRQVRQVLPGWRGPLVLDVAADESAMDAELGAHQQQYAGIAAVTTTVNGATRRGNPVHVFCNPRIFADLEPKGAQVVITHEAAHVATGATFTPMPKWLSEGFADYVALAHAGVPVSVAARQILDRMSSHGLPKRLPSPADLKPTAHGLGATYEEAWLATRFVGRRYGGARLLRFYRAVSHGMPQAAAFRRVLGTSESRFVATWRADLARLLRGEAGRG